MNLYDPAKSLLDSLDPMKQMNEDMKRLLDPMYDINKSLGSMISVSDSIAYAFTPMKAFNEQIGMLTKPYGEFEKTIGNMLDPMKKWNEQMETMLNPYKGFEKYFDAFKPASTHWNDISNLSSAMQNALSSVSLASLQNYDELFTSSMSSYKTLAAAIAGKNFEHFLPKNFDSIIANVIVQEAEYRQILASYPVAENDETALMEELQAVKDEILEAVNSKTAKIEEQLEAIYSRIMSTSDSTFRAFFISFIFPIIIGLLTSIIYDYRIKPLIAAVENSNQQVAIKKEVVRNVKFYLTDPQQRVHYRIVTTNVLTVRNGKSKSSRKIGYTFFGDVVEVVRKERNWCLIRRYDRESETSIQGWVLTRYLGRIR